MSLVSFREKVFDKPTFCRVTYLHSDIECYALRTSEVKYDPKTGRHRGECIAMYIFGVPDADLSTEVRFILEEYRNFRFVNKEEKRKYRNEIALLLQEWGALNSIITWYPPYITKEQYLRIDELFLNEPKKEKQNV